MCFDFRPRRSTPRTTTAASDARGLVSAAGSAAGRRPSRHSKPPRAMSQLPEQKRRTAYFSSCPSLCDRPIGGDLLPTTAATRGAVCPYPFPLEMAGDPSKVSARIAAVQITLHGLLNGHAGFVKDITVGGFNLSFASDAGNRRSCG